MKATIRDREALSALRPLEVAAYLRATGWAQKDLAPGRFSKWVKGSGSRESFEVVLPLNPEYGDFAHRMVDLLSTLEIAEKRPQTELYRDLLAWTADVLRVRVQSQGAESGTLMLEEGIRLVENVWELMGAAACATVEPRACYRTRKPVKAEEFLKHLRLGQTEQGSYVLKVQSKVPPALSPEATHGNGVLFEVEEPFERRAMTTLARAIEASRAAAEEAAISGKWDSFREGIPAGVSANLCEALAGLGAMTEGRRLLSVEFNWAPARPQTVKAPGRVDLSQDALTVIAEAGRLFREMSVLEDVEVHGVVVRLSREEGSPTGTATVYGVVEGEMRRVQLRLEEGDYNRAIAAHRDRTAVRCSGDIVRQGSVWTFQTLREFTLLNE